MLFLVCSVLFWALHLCFDSGMNDEMKLRLAYAEIARLKEEMASANRGQVDLVAHDQALRADFERQRAEDRLMA